MDTPRVASLLDFRGKVVLVAEAGAAFVAHYRHHGDEAAALVLRITGEGGRAIRAAADLDLEDDVARLVARAVEAFGHLDVLINNAGTYPMAGLLDMTAA